MRVKLKTGFLKVQECELTAGESGLFLRSDSGEWQLPFSELVRFSVTGSPELLTRFSLETKDAVYDGKFEKREDAQKLIEKLSRVSGKNLEISFSGINA